MDGFAQWCGGILENRIAGHIPKRASFRAGVMVFADVSVIAVLTKVPEGTSHAKVEAWCDN